MRQLGAVTRNESLLEILHKIVEAVASRLGGEEFVLDEGGCGHQAGSRVRSPLESPSCWMVTHLFIILQDPVLCAISQSLLAREDEAKIKRRSQTLYLPVGGDPKLLKKNDPLKKVLEWIEATQTN